VARAASETGSCEMDAPLRKVNLNASCAVHHRRLVPASLLSSRSQSAASDGRRCTLEHSFLFALHEYLGLALLGHAACIPATSDRAAFPVWQQDPGWQDVLDDTLATGSLILHRWGGAAAPGVESCSLVPPEMVHALVAHGRDVLAQLGDERCPWVAVAIWGFNDSPVAWDERKEHGATEGGENDYILVLLPDQQYLIFTMNGLSLS